MICARCKKAFTENQVQCFVDNPLLIQRLGERRLPNGKYAVLHCPQCHRSLNRCFIFLLIMFAIAVPLISFIEIQESIQKRELWSLILVPLIACGWWFYRWTRNNIYRARLFDPTSAEHLRAKETWSLLSTENAVALREYINTHHTIESIKQLRSISSGLGLTQAIDIVKLIETGRL